MYDYSYSYCYLKAIHHGDEEGYHENVVEVGDLEEAALFIGFDSTVGNVEIHKEIHH